MRKVFFGWKAEREKVENGTLLCRKNGIIKLEFQASHLAKAGILIFNETYVYFDDETDKVEFLFNDKELPNWVEPLVLDEENAQKIPNISMDLYTIECVRDLIYWWFEVYCHKILTSEKKERIAKLVGLNFHRKRYCKFIDYGFNHPAYIEYNEKRYKEGK